jgi:hypothetical protein
VLLEAMRAFRSGATPIGAAWRVARTATFDGWSDGWQKLGEHIKYVKLNGNVSFTTFDSCIGVRDDGRADTHRDGGG